MASNPSRLISIAETCRRLGGIHRSTLRRWTEQGLLPEPTPIGPTGRRKMYRESDITDFIEMSEARAA